MTYDLDLLDFANIQRVLQQYAMTPYGRDLMQNLEPAPNRAIAQTMQNCVTEARRLLDSDIEFVLDDVPNCRPSLKQAVNPGAMLNAQALANLRKLIIAGIKVREFVTVHPALLPTDYQSFIPPVLLKEKIDISVTETGRLRQDASPKLENLYSQIQDVKQSTIKKANDYIKAEKLSEYLDKQNKTHWYGDHLVLLVKTECLDKIKGVIKGSQSGGKVQMVEPMVLLAENNKLENLSQEIYAEQQAILRQLTTEVSNNIDNLLQMIDAITWMDTVFAAAQLSKLMNAFPPELSDSNSIELNQVYHPTLLIQFMQGSISMPVPLSIKLGGDKPLMLITGPNTGGKTVVLKTVGLLQLMAQCGLHIPSEGHCQLGWFDTIMVDMGDRQSMYHQLSTFAGHVEVMKKVLQHNKAGALFLLDELGTGTDPEEGASIAMAMIDTLVEKGSLGIVNTHLPQLKPYAKSHRNIQHAAMMFDTQSLKPNYQLEIGKLGQSLGLIIAENNGLPLEVIDKAKVYHAKIATKD